MADHQLQEAGCKTRSCPEQEGMPSGMNGGVLGKNHFQELSGMFSGGGGLELALDISLLDLDMSKTLI